MVLSIFTKKSNRAAAGSVSARLLNAETRGQPGADASGCCLPCSIFYMRIGSDDQPRTRSASCASLHMRLFSVNDNECQSRKQVPTVGTAGPGSLSYYSENQEHFATESFSISPRSGSVPIPGSSQSSSTIRSFPFSSGFATGCKGMPGSATRISSSRR